MSSYSTLARGDPASESSNGNVLWGSYHIEPNGSRTGNPFGDHGSLGVAAAVAFKEWHKK